MALKMALNILKSQIITEANEANEANPKNPIQEYSMNLHSNHETETRGADGRDSERA